MRGKLMSAINMRREDKWNGIDARREDERICDSMRCEWSCKVVIYARQAYEWNQKIVMYARVNGRRGEQTFQ